MAEGLGLRLKYYELKDWQQCQRNCEPKLFPLGKTKGSHKSLKNIWRLENMVLDGWRGYKSYNVYPSVSLAKILNHYS